MNWNVLLCLYLEDDDIAHNENEKCKCILRYYFTAMFSAFSDLFAYDYAADANEDKCATYDAADNIVAVANPLHAVPEFSRGRCDVVY